MPFITSLGRHPCNSCRTVTPKGGTVYQGDITGMTWCLACAETTLHQTPDVTETPKPSVRLPASWGKFAPAAVPVYGETE